MNDAVMAGQVRLGPGKWSGACGQGRARTEVLLVSANVGTALSFLSSRVVKPSDTETGCSESIREKRSNLIARISTQQHRRAGL